jgi:glycosyltransferase involved in cell wall biosynthesis
MRPMKITFVLPHAGMAGGTRVVAIYAKRLRDRGHQVVVVSQPLPRPTLHDQLRSVVKHGHLQATPTSWPSHFDGLSIPHRVLERPRPVSDKDLPDADVVVATWWETAEWVARLSPKKGAKAYFLQHHEVVIDTLHKERVKATWRLPMHKLTISKWLVDLARDEYGDSNVSWVPNSVDLGQFQAPPRGRQASPTVGLLYVDIAWKGCAVSLAAFASAAKKIPGLRLVAFGADSPSAGLALPAGTRFHLLPPQDKLRDIYASCDVWLSASFSEGFGLPILEAMACRCPVVSTAVGGAIDNIQHGINGYLVPVGDTDRLSEYLGKVLAAPKATWQRMSDAAYRTATAYTWDDATTRFEQGLQLAIERHRAGDLAPRLVATPSAA